MGNSELSIASFGMMIGVFIVVYIIAMVVYTLIDKVRKNKRM